MNNECADYPYPPHYYKLFTTPDVLKPPNLAKVASKNANFFALGACESFFDSGEKIAPYYLQDKPPLSGYVLANPSPPSRALLTSLLISLHTSLERYLLSLSVLPSRSRVHLSEISDILHQIFALLKHARATYGARCALVHIFEEEEKRRKMSYSGAFKTLETVQHKLKKIVKN